MKWCMYILRKDVKYDKDYLISSKGLLEGSYIKGYLKVYITVNLNSLRYANRDALNFFAVSIKAIPIIKSRG